MKKSEESVHHTAGTIIAVLLIAMVSLQLFVSFKGLYNPVAMDQAQIARQVARGEGMTTKFIRPIALAQTYHKADNEAKKKTADAQKEAKAEGLDTEEDINIPIQFDSLTIRDTSNAPLNIFANAIALKLTGTDNYDSTIIRDGYYSYAPDRVIASVSAIFFILSIIAIFHLARRVFDTMIASITCTLIILSSVFLEFAISGLPQMLMLFLFTLGLNFLYTAIQRKQNDELPIVPVIIAGLFFSLACLAGWIAFWPMLGFIIFTGIYFKPIGAYSIPPAIILVLLCAWSGYNNYNYSGNIFGAAVYSIYEGIGAQEGGADSIMRSIAQRDIPVDAQTILTMCITRSFTQLNSIVSTMGGCIVAAFFFLAIFHTFKNRAGNTLKWAIFLMWIMSTIGMALYSSDETISSGQIQILSAPMFIAFGLAILFIFIARAEASHANIKGLKQFAIAVVIIVSAAPTIMSLPATLRIGLLSETTGLHQWPPYYPPVMTGKLRENTDADKVIASDQPWAVAWYANRSSTWLPRKTTTFAELDDMFNHGGSSIGGILITPSSHSVEGGLREAFRQYGDFSSFVIEGSMMDLVPAYGSYLTTAAPQNAEQNPVLSKFTKPSSRLMLLGAQMIYYSEKPVANQ